jgi:SAM-dependent methyltransferase
VSLNDPAAVAAEYADEQGLLGRRDAYRYATGPNAPELAFAAVAESAPRTVLEVGCGPGEASERIRRELGADVVAIDISPRMVELARARGVDARLGDVQALDLADGSVDCALAAWMLYHVQDVDRALAELERVLRPGGRLVAVTNGRAHLRELRALLGGEFPTRTFSDENADALLRRHFARVECRDAGGTIEFPDRAAIVAYVASSRKLWDRALPEDFDGGLSVTRAALVYVAEKAA